MHRIDRIRDESQRVYTIYMATCSATGKSYIGFASRWPRRRYGHHMAARKGYKSKFHNAIRKYGEESFTWEVLYQSKDGRHTLDVMEPHFIDLYGTYRDGYNLTMGGDGMVGYKMPPRTEEHKRKHAESLRGYKHSEETRAKVSEAGRGRKHSEESKALMRAKMTGRKLTPEQRAKVSAKAKLRRNSPETIEKMRAAHTGKRHTQETKDLMRQKMTGRVMTEEHRANISASWKGRVVSEETGRKISLANTGKKRSEETREKMKLAWARRKALNLDA
jgi:group I intron endonuclease